MNSELKGQIIKQQSEIACLNFKSTEANQTIKFMEKQMLALQEQLKDATIFIAKIKFDKQPKWRDEQKKNQDFLRE